MSGGHSNRHFEGNKKRETPMEFPFTIRRDDKI